MPDPDPVTAEGPSPTDRTPAIVFDDGRGLLDPLRDLRPIFDARLGALTTLERLTRALRLDPVACFVGPELAAIAAERHALPINTVPDLPADASVLVVNGRCPLPLDVLASLEPGQAAVEKGTGDLVAAMTTPDGARAILTGGDAPALETVEIDDYVLLARPWHARTFRDPCIDLDLTLLLADPAGELPDGCCILGDAPIRVDPSANVLPACVLDATNGPIVIDAGATVRPRATIIGPAYIGANSTVLDGALIKPNTAIGPVCKAAGEIGGTVIQGHSNKGHDGHLGDSWLGEWVNLGAGTTNSNLLNTYAEVTAVAHPHAHRERTGETFLGCVLGDHVKTAIGTRIMTGAVVHTGTMWAATVPISGCVGRFTWATDAGLKPYRIDRFMRAMDAAMSRRGIGASEAYRARLAELAEA
jgi:UDP-N-acetylglucosamine diphosphorylase/glucosamine-1-phosphate N-acetyltransferase